MPGLSHSGFADPGNARRSTPHSQASQPAMPPRLTLSLARADGCFLPGETITGELVWSPGGGDQQQEQLLSSSLREARAVVTVRACVCGWVAVRGNGLAHPYDRPTQQLSGSLHVEWEEGGHSGDDTGALRYSADRVRGWVRWGLPAGLPLTDWSFLRTPVRPLHRPSFLSRRKRCQGRRWTMRAVSK